MVEDEDFESEKLDLKRSAEQTVGSHGREKHARRAPDVVRVAHVPGAGSAIPVQQSHFCRPVLP